MGAEEEPPQREPGQPEPGPPAPGGADLIAPEVSRRVSSILDAVEREATVLRRQAREEAQRYFEYSRRRADGLVAERQRRILVLSDALIGRAERVLAQLEGAEPARAAFDDLVRALGETAERLAREASDYSDFKAPAFSETPPQLAPEPPAPAAVQPAVSTPRPPSSEPAPPAPSHQQPDRPRSPVSRDPRVAPPSEQAGLSDQHWQNLNGTQMVAFQMAAAGSTRGQVEAHVREALGVDEPGPVLDEVFGPGSHEDARVPWARPAP